MRWQELVVGGGVKRNADHLEDTLPAAKKTGKDDLVLFAMKMLISSDEASVCQRAAPEVEQATGALLMLSGLDLLYPGTALQELNVQGPSTEAVMAAILLCLTKMLQELGVINGGEHDASTEGRIKVVVPTNAAASVIGASGANIKQLRQQTGVFVHVEKIAIPPSGGDAAEQIIALGGSIHGLQSALPVIAEHVAQLVNEPWFSSWVASTNAGLVFEGLALEFSGKGKGARAGKDWLGGGTGAPLVPLAQAGEYQGGQRHSLLAFKVLISEREASSIIGRGGATISEIQQETGTRLKLSGKGKCYPGTELQELRAMGETTEAIMQALTRVLGQILEEIGSVSGGETGVEPGGARVKCLAPLGVATSIIGKGGENIRALRAQTGIHVHIDKAAVPPGGGDCSEQVVSLSGPMTGVHLALPTLAEHVASRSAEPWFLQWANTSNVGLHIPGLVLELSGKGQKGGGKSGSSGKWNEPVPWNGKGSGFGAAVQQASSFRRPANAGDMALKFLFSEQEASVIIGPSGAMIGEIQKMTNTRLSLSGRGVYFPGTFLEELNIQGGSTEMVLEAGLECMRKILDQIGWICGDDDNIGPGEGRLKVVVPSQVASQTIGKGGETVKTLRANSGLQIHVEQDRVSQGDMSEQVITLHGPVPGFRVALPELARLVESFVWEPWFPIWAGLSNCSRQGQETWSRGGKDGKDKGEKLRGKSKDCGAGHARQTWGGHDGWSYGGGKGYCGGSRGFAAASHQGPDERFAAKRIASTGQVAVKFLVSPKEASCIIGPHGSRIAEIQTATITKLTISGRNQFYPGTQSQEVNVQGNSPDSVLSSLAMCLGKVVEDTGSVNGGDATVHQGSAKLKMLVPVAVAEAMAGSLNSEALQQLRSEMGVEIEVDPEAIPAQGDCAEKGITFWGPLEGIQAAAPVVIRRIGDLVHEPWFPAWATHSNCGCPGIASQVAAPALWGSHPGLESMLGIDPSSLGLDAETLAALSGPPPGH